MSDKKPGFFKRLLGSLLGKKEEVPEAAPEPRDESRAEPRDQTAAPVQAPMVPGKPKPEPAPAPKTKAKARPRPAPAPKAQTRLKAKPAPKAKAAAIPKPEPEPHPAPKAKATAAPKPASIPAPEPAPRPKAEATPKPGPAPAPEGKVEHALAPRPQPEPLRPQAPPPTVPVAEKPQKKGWFSRLRDGLSKTSGALTENITSIFTKRKLDEETLQQLEDALIQADLGVDMAMRITAEVARGRFNKEIAPEEVRAVLGAEVASVLENVAHPLELDATRKPNVILVVGVNGTGKTTTIGKLANQFRNDGKRVLLAAGDTFRAAAIDQLKIWGERTGAPVIAGEVGADAAGLAFDAFTRAREEAADVLLIDTAGRLQNKADLMAELAKVVRVLKKIDATAPHSVLLVLDATTGQNAIRQVEVFRDIAGVTGLIMTKLDGTARGGILVAIAETFSLPVHAIGVGEGVDDLQPFDAYEFASAIAGAQEKVDA